MTNQEFSNEFDILYNNISSNQAPGLDEYEKSVFLTDAQDALVLEMITGKNPVGDSFEKTEELREYLTNIIRTSQLQPLDGGVTLKLSNNSTLYSPPTDLWFIIYEDVELDTTDTNLNCDSLGRVEVTPVTHDEFKRVINNPFRGPNINRVLRLNASNTLELVSSIKIKTYKIRYLSRLDPIILVDLPEGLSVRGETKETNCKLNPALHEAILERAVQLAKISMGLIETGR